jgi:UDP-2,3-diacylglucosamine pyrophosphatase LpxH
LIVFPSTSDQCSKLDITTTMATKKKAAKPADIMDVTPGEVLRVLREHGYPRLVHGHTHRPDCHALSAQHVRWVLSDWDLDAATPRASVLRLRAEAAGAAPSALRWERLTPADAVNAG